MAERVEKLFGIVRVVNEPTRGDLFDNPLLSAGPDGQPQKVGLDTFEPLFQIHSNCSVGRFSPATAACSANLHNEALRNASGGARAPLGRRRSNISASASVRAGRLNRGGGHSRVWARRLPSNSIGQRSHLLTFLACEVFEDRGGSRESPSRPPVRAGLQCMRDGLSNQSLLVLHEGSSGRATVGRPIRQVSL